MRIGVIGGAKRLEARLRDLADAEGHQVEFHAGHMKGTGWVGANTGHERFSYLMLQ